MALALPHRRFRRMASAVVAALALAGALAASRAEADFHLVHIDEIMAGRDGNANVQLVALEMEADLQKCQGTGLIDDFERESCRPVGDGARLVFFDAAGTQTAEFVFPGNPRIGESGRAVLVATQEYANLGTTPSPDFIMPPSVVPNSGKICYRNRPGALFFANLCVSYGDFTGDTEGFGPPAPALPIAGNMSLGRVSSDFGNAAFGLRASAARNNCGQVSSASRCLHVAKA